MAIPNILQSGQMSFLGTDINSSVLNQTQIQNSLTGLTTSSEIIIALAPLSNLVGSIGVSITNTAGAGQLDIIYDASINLDNILTSTYKFTPRVVNDSAGVITLANILDKFTITGYQRIGTNPYVAVTLIMVTGLLYSSSALKFTCTSFGQSTFTDSSSTGGANLPQYVGQPIANLTGTYASTSTFDINSAPTQLNVIYITNYALNSITGYNANPVTGTLAVFGTSPATGSGPRNIIHDLANKNLYVANESSSNVSQFSITPGTNQAVALIPAAVSTGANPYQVVISPTGDHAYAVSTGTTSIYQYAINPVGGAWTPLGTPTIPCDSTSTSIAISHSGKFVYTVSISLNRVSMYERNLSTGELNALLPATFSISGGGLTIIITPDDQFMYVSGNSATIINMISINGTTGQLSALPGSSIGATSTGPTYMAVDPTSKYLYVCNGLAFIDIYDIQINGTIVAHSPTRVAVPASSKGVAVDPSGKFLYATANNDTIAQFTRNISTGDLNPMSPTTVATAVGAAPFSIIAI